MLLFVLWAQDAPKEAGDPFQVLHLSAPERAGLGRGRQRWASSAPSSGTFRATGPRLRRP